MRSLSEECSEKIRKKDVVMTAGRWSSWSIQIPPFLMLWWHAMKAGSTTMAQRPWDRVPSGSMLALLDPRRPDSSNPPTNIWWSLFWQHWHDLHALGSHWTDSQQGLLCWGFKGVQEERSALFKSGQWHFHQDNAPVHNSILVTDYLTKMGITLPIVQSLLPVTVGYYLSARKNFETVVMRKLRRKRLWRRSLTRSHERTSMGPSRCLCNGTAGALQPEEITSKGTRVSCVYYQ